MSTEWANTISYNDFVTAVQNAYRGNSSLTWSQVSQSLANAGCTTDNYLNYLETYPNAVDVVKNANGSIRSVRVNPYASIFSESTWGEATSAGSYNSNLMPPSSGSSTTAIMSIPGNPLVDSTTKKLTFTQGMKQAGNFIMKEVTPAVVAAGIGIKLGKAIDGAIYNIGNALGLDPPDALNPETWDSITSGDDSFSARLFNMVFGIDDNGNTQGYIDENAFAYMAQWLSTQNFFANGNTITPSINLNETFKIKGISGTYDLDEFFSLYSTLSNNSVTRFNWSFSDFVQTISNAFTHSGYTINDYVLLAETSQIDISVCGCIKDKNYYLYPVAGGPWLYSVDKNMIRNVTIYNNDSTNKPAWALELMTECTFIKNCNGIHLYVKDSISGYDTAYLNNINSEPGVIIDGLSNQPNALLPDTSNWNDPVSTLASLKEQYPELFENAISQDVIQPDGSTHTYTYIPTGFPMPDGSTGTQTQENTQVQPDVSPEELVDYLRDILIPTLPSNPPDTGEGNTPPVVIPTGSASSLWSIYNPSQEQLDSFGAWLWSSDLVEQIKKLFNNPMESIIGVHKVFAQPNVAGIATIKCGYIDSGVSSNYIKDQYVSIDCGSVLLTEYFGNVFDYDPYTKINLFLPFIGIVPLNVSDVMRSRISIKYNVDVITGACLAEVHINRDGVGGIIYTFSGSCIVSYPLSSGSYAGIIGGVLGIAGGIIGTIASGGALAPLALGAAASVSHLHTNVQKSGSFSGAPGAMGAKIPYLIITRPQTCLADNYEVYDGIGANHTTQLSQCSGYTKVKEVHLKVPNAYESELKEIETMLLSGILI